MEIKDTRLIVSKSLAERIRRLGSRAAANIAAVAMMVAVAGSCQSGGSSDDDGVYAVDADTCMYSKEFYVGADLSSANELEDAGVKYTLGGDTIDLYKTIHKFGGNLVRLRLWHNPTWGKYSKLDDVKRGAKRIKDANMKFMLDFHYSDTWTDQERSIAPAAWTSIAKVTETLVDSVYNYTFTTLEELNKDGVLPSVVQLGNELHNNMMVLNSSELTPLDHKRNAQLINAALKAVRDFNRSNHTEVKTALHVGLQDKGTLKWVKDMKDNGLKRFDILAISYYPQWHRYSIKKLGKLSADLYRKHGVQLLVAETGHIWTHSWNDNTNNIMDEGYSEYADAVCPQMQKDFLLSVKHALRTNRGYGVLAWEPEWVSSNVTTRWGNGSTWENVAFFDFKNEMLLHGGMDFLNDNNGKVTFMVDVPCAIADTKCYITGSFLDDGFDHWQIVPMKRVGSTSTFTFTTYLSYSQTVEYYYLSDSTWRAKEDVPQRFRRYNGYRGYTLPYGKDRAVVRDVYGGK